MIGKKISHYKILEKLPITSGQVGEGGMSQNHPRAIRQVVVILCIPMERSVLGRHEE